MRVSLPVALTGAALVSLAAASNCISSGDETVINAAFSAGGAGTIVQLCASAVITIHNTITFTADNQELSTQGYPTGDTRGTIILNAEGTNVTALIEGSSRHGIRLLNIQVDGNRAGNGVMNIGSSANIEIGGNSNGQIVSHVASRHPRGWSCLHITEGSAGTGSNACVNATVTNNDIGPCGNEGVGADGFGLWADGISFACSQSVVSGNTVSGSTDGAIVLFGAPGTHVTGNTIISSPTDSGFGAINMVDDLSTYNGSFSGVVVSNNVITGQKLFAAGIAMGSCVWGGSCDGAPLSGPATITDNTFAGNITFPMAINRWTGGLTVTGNDVSKVNVDSTFADDGSCSAPVRALFDANAHLSYYPPGLTGPFTLQSGFVQSTGNPNFFICTTPPLNSTVSFGLGELVVNTTPDNFAELHGGYSFTYDNSAHIIVYNNSGTNTVVPWVFGKTVSACNHLCTLVFQGDGNFVSYYNNTPLWASGTNGVGVELECYNQSPWVQIFNSAGKVVWNAIQGKV